MVEILEPDKHGHSSTHSFKIRFAQYYKSPYQTILTLTYLLVNRRLSIKSASVLIGSLVTRSSVALVLGVWCHEYII